MRPKKPRERRYCMHTSTMLTPTQHAQLVKIAEREGRCLSSLLRHMIEQLIRLKERSS